VKHHEKWTARFARLATEWTGSSTAFMLAVLLIVLWVASYPLFGVERFDTWQLIINTLTTIITFLMVFLIQRSQNKDSQAIHLKLNELVAATQGASNRLISAEKLTEEELILLRDHYAKLVELAAVDHCLTKSHSIEEAVGKHKRKLKRPAEKEAGNGKAARE